MDPGRARKILDVAQSAFISMDERGAISCRNIRGEETFGLTASRPMVVMRRAAGAGGPRCDAAPSDPLARVWGPWRSLESSRST